MERHQYDGCYSDMVGGELADGKNQCSDLKLSSLQLMRELSVDSHYEQQTSSHVIWSNLNINNNNNNKIEKLSISAAFLKLCPSVAASTSLHNVTVIVKVSVLSTWRSEVSYIIVVPSLSGLQLQSKGHLPPNIILYNPRNRRWGGQRSNLDNSSMWPDLSVVAQTDLRSSRNPRTEEFTYLSQSMKELYFTNGRLQENESGRHGAAPHCRLFFIC